VYTGSADLYVYFYARGYHLLKPGGQLADITSNKYLRANYGKGLRKFLAEKVAMCAIIDFGDLPVFEAAAYPCIVIGAKTIPAESIPAAAVKSMDGMEDLPGALANGVSLNSTDLIAGEWQISDTATQRVFAKIKSAGVPLGQYVNGRIFIGLKTALNQAFVIDEAKRTELTAADPKSTELIKPWLRGRDIKRWRTKPSGLYVIAIQNSGDSDADNVWGNAKDEAEARNIFKTAYPIIHEYLSQFEQALRTRQDQGRWWWELRACAYYSVFGQKKIIYPDITSIPLFAYEDQGLYLDMTAFAIPIDDVYLFAVLNSTISTFFISLVSSSIQGGYIRVKRQYIERFPIPNPPADLRERIAAVARACLAAAKDHPDRLPALEAELNALVYQAYGLDEDDIAVIEGSIGGKQKLELTNLDELIGDDDAT